MKEIINNFFKRVYNSFNSLNSQNKLIVIFAIVVIASLLYFGVIKNNTRSGNINYGKLSEEQILNTSNAITDRGVNKQLDNILNKISDVLYGRYMYNNRTVSVKELYTATVNETLKKSVSYKQFNKKINTIFESALSSSNGEGINNFIEEVRYSPEYDIYMIKIKNTDSFIGITTSISGGSYEITYI